AKLFRLVPVRATYALQHLACTSPLPEAREEHRMVALELVDPTTLLCERRATSQLREHDRRASNQLREFDELSCEGALSQQLDVHGGVDDRDPATALRHPCA